MISSKNVYLYSPAQFHLFTAQRYPNNETISHVSYVRIKKPYDLLSVCIPVFAQVLVANDGKDFSGLANPRG
jgi:hypothetical protein